MNGVKTITRSGSSYVDKSRPLPIHYRMSWTPNGRAIRIDLLRPPVSIRFFILGSDSQEQFFLFFYFHF